MLLQESLWYREKIEKHVHPGDVIINLGSSSRYFRERIQPHIHENVFVPLNHKETEIYHVDIKSDEGVDLIGDFADQLFLDSLRVYEPNCVICSNLLEHLDQREKICQAIVELLPVGGLLFVSCPRDYPYHPDPIDTMYRPNVAELAKEFPSTALVEGDIVQCGTWREKLNYQRDLNYLKFYYLQLKSFIRLFIPFYNPQEWWKQISGTDRVRMDQELSATCVILRKI